MAGRRPAEAIPIQLRFPTAGLPVEVRGEFTHWFAPLPLRPSQRGDGHWEATLRLPTGVYAYKFRTDDGAWHLDPYNPRTRGRGGARDSLLVVGGAAEPVLHAPAWPYAYLGDDGRLCLRAGLRRGVHAAGERLELRYFTDDPDGSRTLPMQRLGPIGSDDEHLWFEAWLPSSERAVDYLFRLESGACVGRGEAGGQALRLRLADVRQRTPAWWRDAVVYTILLDRFRRRGGPWPAAPLPAGERPPGDERGRAGGDLWGVLDALPYLADLGVTVLHLTPVAASPSAHRYDATNPLAVDDALGGEAALRALLEAAHLRGLRVLLDVTLTHVHRDFLPFCDVRAAGPASPYWRWFQPYRFPFRDGLDPGYAHYQKGQWQEPLLNLDNPEVAEYLINACRHLAGLGADGFRIDAAADVPLPLLERLAAAVRAARPGALLLGEVTPDNGFRFTAGALDAATDFAVEHALWDWLWRRTIDATGAAARLARCRFQRGADAAAVAFAGTHDQPRLASLLAEPAAARLAHLLVLTGPAVPAIYYGDEVGLRSPAAQVAGRDFEDAWPDRQCMPWHEAAWDAATQALFRDALRLRRQHAALGRGDQEFLEVPADAAADVLAFRRRCGEDVVEVYANGGAATRALPLAADAPSAATLRLGLGDVALDGVSLRLGPWAAAVVARHAAPAAASLWRQALDENAERCDAAFRAGEVAGLTLPTHLYLTVTERCNLRCGHCITDAPARTADGRARTLQPWLLDALDDAGALAAAHYFAFAHGGESLVAPIFFEVLARIQRARAGRPYDVHLLSNGMLLHAATVHRLIDLGVTSLAVSLDGGTPATNDGLREGCDLARVLSHLHAAVRIRSQRQADLRIGVSTVLTRSGRPELATLGELLVETGVDWIKVEELVPATPLAARELVRPGGRRSAEAVAALRGVAEPAGVVVVDHLAPPAGCLCRAMGRAMGTAPDAAPDAQRLAEFRASDDFCNRATLLPCRMAWQQACIDPDGAVRPIDYAQPPLGRLSEAPLLAIWHGEPAQRLRLQALHAVALDRAARERCPHRM